MKLYRIEYRKDGVFVYFQYARFANLEDLHYEAQYHLSHFPGQTYTFAEVLE
jgi:hypothetical protein